MLAFIRKVVYSAPTCQLLSIASPDEATGKRGWACKAMLAVSRIKIELGDKKSSVRSRKRSMRSFARSRRIRWRKLASRSSAPALKRCGSVWQNIYEIHLQTIVA